jgi:hypothetical protein
MLMVRSSSLNDSFPISSKDSLLTLEFAFSQIVSPNNMPETCPAYQRSDDPISHDIRKVTEPLVRHAGVIFAIRDCVKTQTTKSVL